MTEKGDAIRAAERMLAVRFPEDYASWLRHTDGLERELGGCYLSLYSVGELVERNRGYAVPEFMPGLVLIGTDGGGEGVGLDVRGDNTPVVLVNLSSLGWDESTYQGGSFGAFLDERLLGHPFRSEAT